jgi:hypothetical protein
VIYVLSDRVSLGGRSLAESIQEGGHEAIFAHRLTRRRRVRLRSGKVRIEEVLIRPPGPQDLVVVWGGTAMGGGGKRLNDAPPRSKFHEMLALNAKGVPVPPFSPKPVEGWLGRRSTHIGGKDFTHPPLRPDYWVQKLDLVREWRLHCFRHGEEVVVLRRAEKRPIVGAHPWIRSYDTGWRLSYNANPVPKGLRSRARESLLALGLDFGAVDMAQDAGGKLWVLEVNRRPGLDEDGQTVVRYAQHIVKEL